MISVFPRRASNVPRFFFVVSLTFIAAPFVVFAAPPTGFQTTQVIGSGLTGPTGFEFSPDGRVFILERTGAVKIYKNGGLLSQPFVTLAATSTGDRGLIGIAFDPDFTSNHFVYFYYTGLDSFNHLVRFDASGDVATGSPVELYRTFFPSDQLHVGGTVRFGPDNKIYLSIGDNGNGPNSQSLDNPFGKIIRLNKDGSIPSDNPFVGQNGVDPSIWAYGLRNPFRFQFDSGSGRLYVGDVGGNTWEEINFIQRGLNYGWPICEGVCTTNGMTNPIHAYNHNGDSAAVAGGPVYRGTMFPSGYQGNLFFADYAAGFIKYLTMDANGTVTGVQNFDTNAGSVVDLKVAPDGSLWYVTFIPARLYRVTNSAANGVPTAIGTADVTKGLAPLTVHFRGASSTDPEGQPLSFLWNFGDNSTSSLMNPTKAYNVVGTYTVELTVSDGTNSAQAPPLVIQVGTPPIVTIGAPQDGSTYRAGDIIFWSGSGTDGAGLDLPDTAFTTEIIFHHDTHIHPFVGPLQVKSGEFTIPATGESSADTWFEIKITGLDTNGLATAKSVFVYPQKVNLTFATNPPGLTLFLDGSPISTPQTIQHVIGFKRTISVPNGQTQGGTFYDFASWSDGGGQSHVITAPGSDTTYTANFTAAPGPPVVQGLTGSYFNNIDFTAPIFTRVDQTVNFDWGGGSPSSSIGIDTFSVRWTGQVQPQFSEIYTFYTSTDDGVRLWVNDQPLVDKWIDQGETEWSGSIPLIGGERYAIRMEYYERGGGAAARLEWSSQSLPHQTIPTANLFSVVTTSSPPVPPPAPFDFSITTTGSVSIEAGSSGTAPVNLGLLSGVSQPASLSISGLPAGVIGTFLPTVCTPGCSSTMTIKTSTSTPVGNSTVSVTATAGATARNTQFSLAITPAPLLPLPPPPPPISTSTYLGEYWNTPTATNAPLFPIGTPALTRNDPDINFNWEQGSPNSLIAPDHFVVRWTRLADFESSTYRFTATADDGIRVYVDNQLILDKWIDQGPTTYTVDRAMTVGSRAIKVEYYENGGGAVANFSFVKLTQQASGNGLTGAYYDNKNFTGATMTRTDATVNFNWGSGSPASAIGPDTFSVRWTGQVMPQYSQTYRFYTKTDDGVRLWINNQLLVDKWVDQGGTEWSGTIALSAGQKYDVKMEYYENGGGASAQLRWSAPSQAKQIIPQSRLFPTP